jgi:hypothetical protein
MQINQPFRVFGKMCGAIRRSVATGGALCVMATGIPALAHQPPHLLDRPTLQYDAHAVSKPRGLPADLATPIPRMPTQQESANKAKPPTNEQNSQDKTESEQTRVTIERLTAEVDRLKKKVAGLEKDRRVDVIQERLTREEQRAETLQSQLSGTIEKEAGLQARLEEIDEQMRPENIERASAGAARYDLTKSAIACAVDLPAKSTASKHNWIRWLIAANASHSPQTPGCGARLRLQLTRQRTHKRKRAISRVSFQPPGLCRRSFTVLILKSPVAPANRSLRCR